MKKDYETELKNLKSTKIQLEAGNQTLLRQMQELKDKLTVYRGNVEESTGPSISTGPRPPPRPKKEGEESGEPSAPETPPKKLEKAATLRPESPAPGSRTSGVFTLPFKPGHSPSLSTGSKQMTMPQLFSHLNPEMTAQQIQQQIQPGFQYLPPASTSVVPVPETQLSKKEKKEQEKKEKEMKRKSKNGSPPVPETPSPLALSRQGSYNFIPSVVSISESHQVIETHGKQPNFQYDIWESAQKIVVAFDVPGTELNQMDIYITRFAVTISRRVGLFEEKFLFNSGKYNAVVLNRLDSGIVQTIRNEVPLPVPVQPNKKQAFVYHGTVYVTLEKLDTPIFSLVSMDWQNAPEF